MLDVVKLLNLLNIPYWTKGKNVSPGRVSVRCPFCGDTSNHGSFGKWGDYKCWKCSGGPPIEALRQLSSCSIQRIRSCWALCSSGSSSAPVHKEVTYAKQLTVPGQQLLPMHVNYLKARGLDPLYLQQHYGILGAGPNCVWEGSSFSMRIIIPIKDIDGTTISFQGRDVTGHQMLRYKVCPIEKSLKHYKDVVYGCDVASELSHVVVVEGIFDAWKLGTGAVATFGTGMTQQQLLFLANHWAHITFFFDPEPEAQKKAMLYARQLADLGVEADVACEDFGKAPDGSQRDAGDLLPHEVARVRSELGI